MSFTEGQAALLDGVALTATALLALDQSQFVRYLEKNTGDDGEFDISDLAGVERLSRSQRDELGQRLR